MTHWIGSASCGLREVWLRGAAFWRSFLFFWAHYGWDEKSYYVPRATYKTSRTSYVVRSNAQITPAAVPSGPLYPSD